MAQGRDISHKLLVYLVASLSIGLFVAHKAYAAGGDNTYCAANEIWHDPTGATMDGPANLPKTCVYTAMSASPSPGKVTVIPANDAYTDIQTILDSAQCGDTIEFKAGASYYIAGSGLTLSQVCPSNAWITIRTTTDDSQLPPEGTRISPCYSNVSSLLGRPAYACPAGGPAPLMPILISSATNVPVFIANGGSHYRFIGLEVTQIPGIKEGVKLVDLTSGDHMIVDRCWIHGTPLDELQGGVKMQGTYIAVIDSYLNDHKCLMHSSCVDAQAVSGGVGNNIQGPNKVVNNFLEGSGQSFIWGGGAATLTPTDIEIRRNYNYKPAYLWRADSPGYLFADNQIIVKNLGEFKNATRALLEGNIFEYNWQGESDETGYAFLIGPKNQGGTAPTATVTDITIRNTKIAHTTNSMQIGSGLDTQTHHGTYGIRRVSVHDNLFDDINYSNYTVNSTGPGGFGFTLSNALGAAYEPDHITFQHNTLLTMGEAYNGGFSPVGDLSGGGAKFDSIVWKDNIAPALCQGTEGTSIIKGGCVGMLSALTINTTYQNNVLMANMWSQAPKVVPSNFPPSNQTCNSSGATCFPNQWAPVQFVNYDNGNGGDYHLSNSSPYKNAGTDKLDIGANIDAVNCSTLYVDVGGPIAPASQCKTDESSLPTLGSISPNIVQAGHSGFTLTATGTNFANGSAVQWQGSALPTKFVNSTTLTAAIPTSYLIIGSSVNITVMNPGPSGGMTQPQILTVNNPVPLITSLTPNTTSAGSNGFTLTENGTNFMMNSQVYLNGQPRQTNYVSNTQLTSLVLVDDVVAPGTATISIITPTPGGGTATFPLLISGTNYAPVLTGTRTVKITEWSFYNYQVDAAECDDATELIYGVCSYKAVGLPAALTISTTTGHISGIPQVQGVFVATLTATNNVGTSPPFQFSITITNQNDPVITSTLKSSATVAVPYSYQITSDEPIQTYAATGLPPSKSLTLDTKTGLITGTPVAVDVGTYTVQMTVTNSTGPGQASMTLTIYPANNPVPTLTSLDPNTAVSGGPAFTLTINGTNFMSSSTVKWAGQLRDSQFISDKKMTASILASDISSPRSANVQVFNPTPGGGQSNVLTFTITKSGGGGGNKVPTLTSMSPGSATAGGAGFTLRVTGSNFITVSSIQWNGSNLATTYVSATQLYAWVPTKDIANAGTASVTVFNPAPGGGASKSLTFTINGTKGGTNDGTAPVAPLLNLPAELPINSVISASYYGQDPVVAYQWTFTLLNPSSQVSPNQGTNMGDQSTPMGAVKTQSPQASLSAVPLVLGSYLVSVIAIDANDIASPPAQAYVTLVAADLVSVRLYPNPWKANKHEGLPIKFDNLSGNSTIKIFSLSGREVRTLPKSSGTVTWDLMNDSGDKVASGIYIYLIKTDDGQKKTGKLAIIK